MICDAKDLSPDQKAPFWKRSWDAAYWKAKRSASVPLSLPPCRISGNSKSRTN